MVEKTKTKKRKENMKKYMKIIVGLICAVMVVSVASGAEAEVKESLFNKGEVGLSLGTGYTVDPSALFQNEYALNLNAGAFWFPTRNLGFEAVVPFYQTKGISVSEVQAGMLLRLPLAKQTPLFRNLSPYAGLGGVYGWNYENKWAYIAKAGLDVRFNKKWGVFTEYQYRNNELSHWGQGETSIVGGLKFVF